MTPPVLDAVFPEQLTRLIRWRRDVRHFDRRPLAPTDLKWLFEMAALAPSVGHSQPWRFVRIRSAELREALAAHVDAASTTAAATIADTDRRARYASLKLHGLREAPEIVAVFCDDDPVAGHGWAARRWRRRCAIPRSWRSTPCGWPPDRAGSGSAGYRSSIPTR